METIKRYLSDIMPSDVSREPMFEPKKNRGKIDISFLVLVTVLLVIGLIMLFSASYAYSYYNNDGDSFHYIKHQLIFAGFGYATMIFLAMVNHKYMRRWSIFVYVLSVALLFVTLFMRNERGFARWIYIGSFQFQPSEVAKFAIVLLFAHIATANANKIKTLRYGVLPFGVFLGIIEVFIIAERHLSGTIIIGLLGLAMMWYSGTKLKYFGVLLIALAVLVLIIIIVPSFMQYAYTRVEMWIDPYTDAQGDGYQTIQSLIAIGSGGLWGTGIGNSRQKYLYIPEPQNDFIFAVGCEEVGFVGATIILVLFAMLIWRGYSIALHCQDKFGSLLAAGCITHIGMQVVLNIAVVTNTIPNTGISLPFFSYGGTALLMTLGEMGVVLSVSKNSSLTKQ